MPDNEEVKNEEVKNEENRMNMVFIISIVELVLKYGIPAAMNVINDWGKQNPTILDINELRERVKKPEEYFLPGDPDPQ